MPRPIPDLRIKISKPNKKNKKLELFKRPSGRLRMKVNDKWFKNKLEFTTKKLMELLESNIEKELEIK